MRKEPSGAAAAASNPIITVSRVAGVLTDRVHQFITAELTRIASSMGIENCHFEPLETNDGYKVFSYKTCESFPGLQIEAHIQYVKLKSKNKNQKSSKRKAPSHGKILQVNLHDIPGFIDKVARLQPDFSKKPHYVNFTNRVSMWFAAPNLEDIKDYLATQPLSELAQKAIRKFLDDNPFASLYLIYDPLLLAKGEQDPLLLELQAFYKDRLMLLDVNQEALFYSADSPINEKIIYWLVRYLLALARDPDVNKRKSVNIVTVKDLLQLLTAVYVRGNIMDCVDNLLIFPSCVDKPREWETLTESREALFNITVCGEINSRGFEVANDMFIPVFTEMDRREEYLTEYTRSFFAILIDRVLNELLLGLQEDFSRYLKQVLQADVADRLSRQLDTVVKKQDVFFSSQMFLTGLFLFGASSFNYTDVASLINLTRAIFFKDRIPSYTDLCHLYHVITIDDWLTAIEALKKNSGVFSAYLAENQILLNEATFHDCRRLGLEMMVTHTAGPLMWQEIVATFRQPSLQALSSRSLQTARITSEGDGAQFIMLTAFLWGESQISISLKHLLLMLVDPVAFQLIIKGRRAWLPEKRAIPALSASELHEKAKQDPGIRELLEFDEQQREKLSRQLQVANEEDALLEKVLQAHQQGNDQDLLNIVQCAREIIGRLQKEFGFMKFELSELVCVLQKIASVQQKKHADAKERQLRALFADLVAATVEDVKQSGLVQQLGQQLERQVESFSQRLVAHVVSRVGTFPASSVNAASAASAAVSAAASNADVAETSKDELFDEMKHMSSRKPSGR